MTAKARYLGWGLQLIVTCVVIVLGVVVYRLDTALTNAREHGVVSGETATVPRENALDLELRSALGRLESMVQRIESIEGKVNALNAGLAPRSVADVARSPARETNDSVVRESIHKPDNRPNIESRFAHEAATSPWGHAAAAAVQDSYSKSYANNRFFAENPGDLSTDCRESVCGVTWSPTSAAATTMSAEERADLFERARWELIALLEGVQDAGYFRFAVSNDSGRPSLELLVDQHDTGGDDAIPDRVAEYLGLSKGASK